MIFLASYAPNGRYVMPTYHMGCLVAWTGDLGALEAVRKLLRAPNDTTLGGAVQAVGTIRLGVRMDTLAARTSWDRYNT